MPQVRVYNLGYDPGTGIGELLHTTTVRHAMGMIRREVAVPVELTVVDERIVPLALELTRELSGAWVEGAGRRSVGFSYRAVHERDHWTCAYCGRSVSRAPACEALLATVDHILPVSAEVAPPGRTSSRRARGATTARRTAPPRRPGCRCASRPTIRPSPTGWEDTSRTSRCCSAPDQGAAPADVTRNAPAATCSYLIYELLSAHD